MFLSRLVMWIGRLRAFLFPFSSNPESRPWLWCAMVVLIGGFELLVALAETKAPPPPVEFDPALKDQEVEPGTKAVALRGDDERLRPETQLQVMIGRTLVTFTGAFTLDWNFQDNLNLESARERDRFRFNPELQLNLIAAFPDGFYLFTELGLEDELTVRQGDKPTNAFDLQVNEFFLQAPLPFDVPSALRIGRQQFFEPRRWFLNETLDGIRLLVDPAPFHFRMSVSTPVPSLDRRVRVFDDIFESRNQIDLLAEAIMDIFAPKQKSKAAIYLLVRDNDTPRDDDPIWVGLRSFGRPKFSFKWSTIPWIKQLLKPRLRYWVDAAFVGGTRASTSIRGYALDIGASYIARKLPLRPYLTLAYAQGSGDSHPDDGIDGNFRQTGFHSNSGKFGGVVNFDYYGVLFDPELSNMRIFTAGFGFRPLSRTSIDVVYHHYEQVELASELRSIDVGADLTGRSTNLGDEFDLIVGVREWPTVRVRWRNGYFIPGSAFEQKDHAFETRLDIQFAF